MAHFFRRAFNVLRRNGTFGLIATNTIRQGDTRQTGLRWICVKGGGTIYAARRRYKWAGAAAVVVSVVWVIKGTLPAPFDLDDKPVQLITAYLFNDGGHESPATLGENQKLGFKGCEIGSLGFLITSDDPLFAQFSELKDPRDLTRLLLKPYVTGEDLNASGLAARRFVFDVDGLNDTEMNLIPAVRNYLSETVRPDFLKRGEIDEHTSEWWHFRRPSLALRKTIGSLPRMLAVSRVSDSVAFTFMGGDSIANSDIICFRFDTFAAFTILQARCHEVWARFFASSMKDDLRYTPTDCFDTFPFPRGWETVEALEPVGREYYEVRAAIMVHQDEGLTTTYNRFHDRDERSPDILRLRELHDAMDHVVLKAYGWSDLAAKARCEFLLDYEDEEDQDDSRPRKRKKPWRYRWPDEIRDQVLTRLLERNVELAKEEQLKSARAKKNKTRKPGPGIETSPDQQRLAI